MSLQDQPLYQFGPFRMQPSERLLLREGKPIALPPKAFETLLVLVQNSGHALSKEELMRIVWPDSFVEENNLTQHISTLRRALGETPDGQSYIETVPRLGYRFTALVSELPRNGDTAILLHRRTRARLAVHEEEVIEEEQAAATREDEPHPGERRSESRRSFQPGLRLILGAVALAAVAIGVVGLRRVITLKQQGAPFQAMKFVRLTTTGTAQNAAISSDGKYVAYVSGDPGDQSLWVRQVATHSDIQVVPAREATYSGVTFSHDGNFIYYTSYRAEYESATAYRVATLGGEPSKVAENVDTGITLAPDDQRIAFARKLAPGAGEELVIANAGGGDERHFAATKAGQFGIAFPAWSPDGKSIASGVWSRSEGATHLGIWTFDVTTGKEKPLGRQTWTSLASLTWLPDGHHLVMSAADTSSGPAGQLWQLSYPGGQLRRITNDLTDYSDVSVTADSRTLVTVGMEVPSNIWVAPAENPSAARQVTSGSVGFGGWSGLAWTPDRRLIYFSVSGGNQELWAMDSDGGHARQLTSSPGWKLQPSACTDGRTVVFTVISESSGNIWKVDTDGSSLKQLTFTGGDEQPVCSPDSRWAIYAGRSGTLQKISVEGGSPSNVTSYRVMNPTISPDGKWIAGFCFAAGRKLAIEIIPFVGGPPAKTIPFERGTLPGESASGMQWTPDGQALAYVDVRKGVSNLWSQPLDGSSPKPLTDFSSGQIFSFAWSRDGRQLALTRGTTSSDVILIRNFK